jgi:tRNA-specific 2-thiouridylase
MGAAAAAAAVGARRRRVVAAAARAAPARPFDAGLAPRSYSAAAAATVAAASATASAAAHLAPGARVAVGLSGGVDSAVAALMLQRHGFDVVGVFMRNWDEAEETGNRNCSVERDRADAEKVARHLGVALVEADFVADYWQSVFSEFLALCARGLTPNPDLACNRYIKFDSLLKFADGLGAAAVATGHYARLVRGAGGDGDVQLLRGVDPLKDQSYFLASVRREALRRTLFPLGEMSKADVRTLAAAEGLPTAAKRSSAGICFIGRRNYADFLAQYVAPSPGRFVDVESGAELGPCADVGVVTHGQRPGVGGAPERVYVVGKDVVRSVVYVAHGRDHPALRARTALLRAPHWLSPAHAEALARHGSLRCETKARYGQAAVPCTLRPLPIGGDVPRSAYCVLSPIDAAVGPGALVAEFDEPVTAITPQQACVMYDGDVCLGSAIIAAPGPTLFELK